MVSFESDYTTGAHEAILRRLLETNLEPQSGYGADAYCMRARDKLRAACGCPQAEVHFLSGGTQTNATVIAAMLSPYLGVVCAESGHIAGHEAGAIEYTGHKVLPLPERDGKLDADALQAFLHRYSADENRAHVVCPGMVYVSHPTEYGTLYTRAELTALHAVCRAHGLPLFLDGARLGYGLASPESDVTLRDIAALTDVFYIGGTKVGALCGEAVIFPRGDAPAHFFSIMKQHGALLAKGRLLGLQFDTLFTDELYLRISRHAIDMAQRLKCGLAELGCTFLRPSPTNQQFVILPDALLDRLRAQIAFGIWEKYDDTHTVVRFVTSWSTTPEEVEILLRALRKLL